LPSKFPQTNVWVGNPIGKQSGENMQKLAIFENEKVRQFLRSARTIDDEARMYMLVAFGMHPKNCRGLDEDSITDGNLLQFKRVKSGKPRRELLSEGVAEVLRDVIKRGKLNKSNTLYQDICKQLGRIVIPNYECGHVSPMTLRHTFALNELRRTMVGGNAPDFDRVAMKMGCTIQVVKQNYIDLEQWEEINSVEHREPLNLTHWRFGESL